MDTIKTCVNYRFNGKKSEKILTTYRFPKRNVKLGKIYRILNEILPRIGCGLLALPMILAVGNAVYDYQLPIVLTVMESLLFIAGGMSFVSAYFSILELDARNQKKWEIIKQEVISND